MGTTIVYLGVLHLLMIVITTLSAITIVNIPMMCCHQYDYSTLNPKTQNPIQPARLVYVRTTLGPSDACSLAPSAELSSLKLSLVIMIRQFSGVRVDLTFSQGHPLLRRNCTRNRHTIQTGINHHHSKMSAPSKTAAACPSSK